MKNYVPTLIITVVALMAQCTNAFPAEDYIVFFGSDRDGIVDEEDIYVMTSWYSDADNIVVDDSHKSEIYSMDPDGGSQTRLTFNDFNEFNLEPAPEDGRLFYVLNEDDDMEIVSINYDGSESERHSDDFENDDFGFSFQPSKDRLVYTCRPRYETEEGEYDTELWELDMDTLEKKRLTHNDKEDYAPALSPDGRFVAYLHSRERPDPVVVSCGSYIFTFSYYERRDALHMLDLDSGEDSEFYNDDLDYYPPEFSPDGRYIATSVRRSSDRFRGTLFSSDGEKLFELPESYGTCTDFRFANDNSLSFFKCRDFDTTSSSIIAVDILYDFDYWEVTPGNYYVGRFDVSPDDMTVFFSAIKDEKMMEDYLWEIFRVEIDTGEITQLTDNRAKDYEVAISALPGETSEE